LKLDSSQPPLIPPESKKTFRSADNVPPLLRFGGIQTTTTSSTSGIHHHNDAGDKKKGSSASVWTGSVLKTVKMNPKGLAPIPVLRLYDSETGIDTTDNNDNTENSKDKDNNNAHAHASSSSSSSSSGVFHFKGSEKISKFFGGLVGAISETLKGSTSTHSTSSHSNSNNNNNNNNANASSKPTSHGKEIKPKEVKGYMIDSYGGYEFWRFDLVLPLQKETRKVGYEIVVAAAGNDDVEKSERKRYDFFVQGLEEDARVRKGVF
jgi:hypothetical protein